MKLYIKQKVFSWGDRFYVKDELGNNRYTVQGEVFSFGKKLHIYDASGSEAAFIQQKVFSFLPRFFVYIGGRQAAEIVKEFTLLFPCYRVNGPGWSVEGQFLAHDYEIKQGSRTVAAIRKAWMTWGDSYELNISDTADEVMALAAVLAIDAVMESDGAAVNVNVNTN